MKEGKEGRIGGRGGFCEGREREIRQIYGYAAEWSGLKNLFLYTVHSESIPTP